MFTRAAQQSHHRDKRCAKMAVIGHTTRAVDPNPQQKLSAAPILENRVGSLRRLGTGKRSCRAGKGRREMSGGYSQAF